MNKVIIAVGYPHPERDVCIEKAFPLATFLKCTFVPKEYAFGEYMPADAEHCDTRKRFIAALERGDALIVVDPWYTTQAETRWYRETAKTFGYEVCFAVVKTDTAKALKRAKSSMTDEQFLCLGQTTFFADRDAPGTLTLS